MTRWKVSVAIAVLGLGLAGMARLAVIQMGPQPDGAFLVSTGQRVEAGSIAFAGRPIDLALHPTRDVFAVMNKGLVFLARAGGEIPRTIAPLGSSAGFRGLAWTPDGTRLLASTEPGHVQTSRLSGEGESLRLQPGPKIVIAPEGDSANPVP